ncbi:MAG: response regulator transcription factor [Bacteroidota bacterium]
MNNTGPKKPAQSICRVVIADDHTLLADGLQKLVESRKEYSVTGKFASGTALLHYLDRQSADILLLDISMPGMDGREVMTHLRSKQPGLKVITLTMHQDGEYIKQMIDLGVHGYVLKMDSESKLLHTMHKVLTEGSYFSEDIMRQYFLRSRKPRSSSVQSVSLTRRELEVLELIVDECTNEQIASRLFISINTVITHRRNLSKKLGVQNTAGLVKKALSMGLTSA